MHLNERFRGCLLGLACGDALGAAVEFLPRGSFAPLTDITGGGTFFLEPGQWTDDTSMALCLAASLVECGGFDADDQMKRYCRWVDEGYFSSIGASFGIGGTVSTALDEYRRSGNPFSGPTDPDTAGNGCIMRLAPVPMFFYPDAAAAIAISGESTRTTHGAKECIAAAGLFGAILFKALSGVSKEAILSPPHFPAGTEIELPQRIRDIAARCYFQKRASEVRGTGYVVECLEAALWCFWTTSSFEEAVLTAANLGDDADTTAAVCGQLAGAHYGSEAIPHGWLRVLAKRELIEELADRLCCGDHQLP